MDPALPTGRTDASNPPPIPYRPSTVTYLTCVNLQPLSLAPLTHPTHTIGVLPSHPPSTVDWFTTSAATPPPPTEAQCPVQEHQGCVGVLVVDPRVEGPYCCIKYDTADQAPHLPSTSKLINIGQINADLKIL